jgi:tRNA threonylcarbamoyl adenosine modification protein YjeE
MKTLKVKLEDLPNFANEFASVLKPGACLCLSGEMGSGKTTFCYFLTKCLLGKTSESFSSPTFTILNQYHADHALLINHIDLYRLDDFEDLESLDFFDLIENENAITYVEWGEKFPELQESYTHVLKFEQDATDPDLRHVTILNSQS